MMVRISRVPIAPFYGFCHRSRRKRLALVRYPRGSGTLWWLFIYLWIETYGHFQ